MGSKIKINTKKWSTYTYNWPGNVRELRNLIERINIVSANESEENIDKSISDILNNKKSIDKETVFRDTFSSPLKEAREQFEKEYLTIQLKNHGNISKTADFIGMMEQRFIEIKTTWHKRYTKNEYNICGAGKVGFSISKQLSSQGHSVTVIDQSSEDIKK